MEKRLTEKILIKITIQFFNFFTTKNIQVKFEIMVWSNKTACAST
jgi:hypothetical protein